MQKKKSFEPTRNYKESLSREHSGAIYGQLELTVVFTNHDHVQFSSAALPFDQFSFNWSQNPFFSTIIDYNALQCMVCAYLFGGISINVTRVLILNKARLK
jgi:hypothetical protein